MTQTRDNVLQRIAAATRERVQRNKERVSLGNMRELALAHAQSEHFPRFGFEDALRAPGMSFICEVKRASPSKGLIAPDFPYLQIAREYQRAGAAAISCLTEPTWFKGSDNILTQISKEVSIPVLRKDFVVDEYMVYQAKAIGAQAVLLICSILDDEQLARCVRTCDEIGISALVEAYEPDEVPRAIKAGARVVGVNNRDLRTFSVDFGRSIKLRPLVGPDRIFVSESGVNTAEDVKRLADANVDAVLVGERLMRSPDKAAAISELRRLL